jgi:iron(III) transport system permease protein
VRNLFVEKNSNPWIFTTIILAVIISLPLAVILSGIFKTGDEAWLHITQNLLGKYVINTLILMAGVAVLSFTLGVSTAWFVSYYDFPARNFFSWSLILPITVPGYIAGFTYTGMLDYTSPLYTFFRENFGINTGQYLFFDILSLPGAIFIFGFTLYPYVYLISRSYFQNQSSQMMEAGLSLGRSAGYMFLRVIIPSARPAIVAGISLALMEVLNDYGLVKYYGVETFTTGIFISWFSFGSLDAAIRLSAILMLFVLALIGLEEFQRGKIRYSSEKSMRHFNRKKVSPVKGLMISLWVLLPFLLGFLIPFYNLVLWSFQVINKGLLTNFTALIINSFWLAATASLLIAVFSVLMAFTVRHYPIRPAKISVRFATLGYALPGAVVAVGLLVIFLWADRNLFAFATAGITGTISALIFAYIVRFMAVGYNSIESGNQKIPVSLDQSAQALGRSKFATLIKINLPLLKNSVIAAMLLVFIDVLKELPLTLILRPFNFDTLAIRSFEYASDERIAEAAPAAVTIILVSLIPVLFLHYYLKKTR